MGAVMKYDRPIQFMRKAAGDDGFTADAGVFAAYGDPLWASRTDISDGEKYAAAQVSAHATARFVVPWSDLTAEITPKDQIACEGITYDISGIKEIGRRARREITANAQVDQ